MDPVLPTLCLLLGIALPLAGLFLLVRRGVRQLEVAHAYAEVARRLRLQPDTRGLSLQGYVLDRRVWIGDVMIGHGPDRRVVTRGVVDLIRPLGLELRISRRPARIGVPGRREPSEPGTGDSDLDKLLRYRAGSGLDLASLFTPQVRASLSRLVARAPDMVVDDHTVRIELRRPENTTEGLHSLVDSMIQLAIDLESARETVACSPVVASHLPDWQALASRRGLAVEPWLPALTGQDDRRRWVVTCLLNQGRAEAQLRFWFAPHDHTGMTLRPQHGLDGYAHVGQDIQLGDERFDAGWVIKGWDPEQIRTLLTPELRTRLFALGARGQLRLDDRLLRVDHLEADADSVDAALTLAREIADELGW